MSNASSKYGPFWAIFVTFFGYLISAQIVVGLFIAGYIAVTGNGDKAAINYFQGNNVGQFLSVAGAYLGIFLTVYLFMRWRKISWSVIGLGRRPRFGDLGNAVIWFIGYYIVLAIVLQIFDAFVPSVNLDQKQQLGFEPGGSLPLIFISLVLLPPLVEEILVRGFLYTGLRARLGRIVSILLASALFGVAHLQLGSGAPPLYVAAIDTFVLSVFLIFLRERTGSLWAGIFVHGLKNGLAFLALFVFVR